MAYILKQFILTAVSRTWPPGLTVPKPLFFYQLWILLKSLTWFLASRCRRSPHCSNLYCTWTSSRHVVCHWPLIVYTLSALKAWPMLESHQYWEMFLCCEQGDWCGCSGHCVNSWSRASHSVNAKLKRSSMRSPGDVTAVPNVNSTWQCPLEAIHVSPLEQG